MNSSRVGILIVDDQEPWCRLVCSILQKDPRLQVVGVASDGLEAIQRAQDLQPDLVLQDIGLPKLNGIEATRQIRQVCPGSKTIFLTQEASADFVQAAFSAGALGYVVKIDACQLLAAIEAALKGQRFVSTSAGALRPQRTSRHEVVFYSHEAGFPEGLAAPVVQALQAGKTTIVVGTESHREDLLQRLKQNCFDIEAAIQARDYIALDVRETLKTLVVNGVPDRACIFTAIDNLIGSSSQAGKPARHGVAAFGECAPLLLADGDPDAAIRIEQLWEELSKQRGVDILCAYPMSSFPAGREDPVFKLICAEHSAVYFC